MITTVTLNPCVHKIVSFSIPVRGPVIRPVTCRYQAGGKGVNAARAAHGLGSDVLAVTTAGGHVGGLLRDSLADDGVSAVLMEVAAATRMSTFIFNERTREFHEYLEGGGPVRTEEARRLLAAVLEAAARSEIVVLSGSSPDSVLDDLFSTVIRELRGTGCKVAVDTYGPPARAVMEGPVPYLFKSNREELRRSFGLDVLDAREVDRFVGGLLEAGARAVVISDGDGEARLYEPDVCTIITPPRVHEINPVGSGDAMLGALVAKLCDGDTLAEAFRYGVAAGAYNASRLEVCVLDQSALESLLGRTAVRLDEAMRP